MVKLGGAVNSDISRRGNANWQQRLRQNSVYDCAGASSDGGSGGSDAGNGICSYHNDNCSCYPDKLKLLGQFLA